MTSQTLAGPINQKNYQEDFQQGKNYEVDKSNWEATQVGGSITILLE